MGSEGRLDPAVRMERLIGRVLLWGVLVASAVALAGALVFLGRHHGERVHLAAFHSEPTAFTHPLSILGALCGATPGRAVIMLGLLMLVALQLARTGLTAIGFGRIRDWLFVALSLFILCVLLVGFIG